MPSVVTGSSEIQVNTFTTGDQSGSRVTTLEGGGFVVTWLSNGQDGSAEGVYAQLYDAAGAPQGLEFRVNTETNDFQGIQAVAALGGGGFVVSWVSTGQDGNGNGVYAQLYNATGTPQGGEFQVNTYTTSEQTDQLITALDGGGFVITWPSLGQDGAGFGIYGQLYDASGAPQGGEFRANTETANTQVTPAIAALDGGGFVIGWESLDQDGDDSGVYAQLYSATGVPLGGEFQVNTETANYQGDTTITALDGGGFVISWSSLGQDGDGFGVFAQLYDATGAPDGGEFRVNTFITNYQGDEVVTALEGGGFVISWPSLGQDGDGSGLYAQLYDATGAPQGGEFRVNTETTGYQGTPTITALEGGGFVISWISYDQDGDDAGVFAQLFSATGARDGEEFQVNTETTGFQGDPKISALDGGFVITWQSLGQDGSGSGVFARTFTINAVPTLTGVSPAVTFAENLVNATPQILDADVTFTDADNDFDGGTITVSGALAEDIIGINNEGTGAGQIGSTGPKITYGGVAIGIVTGGTGGAALVVTLNGAATSAAVEALIENLTYANPSDTPTLERTLTINVTDAAGFDLSDGLAQGPFVELTGADDPLANPPLPTFGANPNPGFVDVDADGDLDMVMGDVSGLFRYFQNSGGTYTEQTGAANPFDGFDTSTYSNPEAIDIDGDGDMDLVTGAGNASSGLLFTWRNNGGGSWTQLVGAGVNPFDGVDVGNLSDVAGADIDGDGDMDLIVGNGAGTIDVFLHNVDHSFTQQVGGANPFDGVDVGSFASPAAADVDGDGDIDLVFGQDQGTIRTFLNDGSGAFAEATGAANPFNGIDVGNTSNTSFVDIDGDGDADLVVGDIGSGDTRVFENTEIPATPPQIVVTVTPENDPPVAADDALAATDEDTAITYPAAALLGNDTDPDGGMLFVSAVGSAVGGNVLLNGDGSVTFTPTLNYNGPASFEYTVSDGAGGTDTGTASFTINPVDDLPVAVDDALGSTDEDNAITYAASALTGNDTDVDGGPLFIASVGNAVGGSVVLNGDGSVTFIPAPDYYGPASFDYALNGGSSATATLTVNPVNEVVAVNDSAVLNEGGTIDLWDLVLGNDFDPEGDSFTITSVGTGGTSGQVIFDAATQTLIYVADGAAIDAAAPGDVIVDRFTYTITDSAGAVSTATVALNVTATADGVRIIGGSGGQTHTGGSGEDYIDGRGGNDVLNGGAEDDTLIGGSGNDTLDGGSGNDDLTGGSGRDVLKGGTGADDLDGGSGDDLLWGGAGDDSLTGGSGADRFETGSNEGDDIITDFDVDADVLALLTGTTVQSSSVSDTDGDGFDDLVINLSTGGTLTLLHVDDFADVTIETVTSIPSESFA